MTKEEIELAKAQNITNFGVQIKSLDDDVFRAERQYREFRQSIINLVTPAMKMFDTLFNVITVDVLLTNSDKAIADFNRKWGSTWRKLNRTSKGWSELCSIYYTAAIKKDLGEYPLFEEAKALERLIVHRYGEDSQAHKLILAYLAWDDCRAEPFYRFPD